MSESPPAAFVASNTDVTQALGETLALFLQPGDAVCLSGPLGAGKTTFTRGLGRGLNVTDSVASPTFVIARRHRGTKMDLLHCDAYRVSSPAEFADLDLDTETSVTVVEWGEPVMGEISDSWLDIQFDRGHGGQEGARVVTLRGRGDRWGDADIAAVERAWREVLS